MFRQIDRYLLRRAVMRYRLGFAQFGEEKIVHKLLAKLGIRDVYYLDIGTNDPMFNNNTYLFYCRGHNGVCVEPNPEFARRIGHDRPRDICLNVGACGLPDAATQTFHIAESNVLSSFSEANAAAASDVSAALEVRVMGINEILGDVCERVPDFVSIDVEGMEMPMLEALDFSRFRPAVFCIETLDLTGGKQQEPIDLLTGQDYAVVADTWVNTIFVDRPRWEAARR